MKIRRFSGHPQVRDWAIILFQGKYQVLVVTGKWTMLRYNYTIEENSLSVTGNRTRLSTRAGLLLPLYSSAAYLFSPVYFLVSISLKLWYLMIARVLDLCLPCQISLQPDLLFYSLSPIHPLSYRYLAH